MKYRYLIVPAFLALAAALFAAPFLVDSEPVSAPTDLRLNQLILDGARAEIENGTRYNSFMLGHYVPTYFCEGREYERAVYPNGDVHPDNGVCTDLIVRACRNAGFDLQELVHEDVTAHQRTYGVTQPDKYIDHRRVWVLEKYFARHLQSLPTAVHDTASDWQAGDIVVWDVGSNHHMHIGIVSDHRTSDGRRPLVIHNIGYFPGVFPGTTHEGDALLGPTKGGRVLYHWQVVGHYRWPDREA
ncbi:DUF1287 domain-containing protein [bacterium]|nr:DUF1287 domain-containing protein [bacterium]MCB2202303.1 DUF1287 domain-containing protein [bacterium]